MQQLMLLAGVGLAIFAFVRWSNSAGPAATARALRQLALAAAGVVVLGLLVRGGASLILPLLIVLLPALLRAWYAWQQSPRVRSSSSPGGKSSTIETRFVRMSLDHATGDMQGTVLAGKYSGRELRELSLSDLMSLWHECRNDPQSAAVLEAYLDRVHGDVWRKQSEQDADTKSRPQSSPMSREEALEVLGLEPGASEDDIKAAHRRLMQRVHPDHGGSNYLAARINQAKECLLG